MSDNDQIVDQATEPQDEAKGLRGQLEAALAENKELKAEKRGAAFHAAGLDPNQGLGKAIFKEYDGELTPDAVLEYAQTEYGYVGDQTSQHPQAEQIQQGQQALDQVGQTAGSVVSPTQTDVLAKAEADGDYNTAMAVKTGQMAEWFYPGRR